MKEEIVLTGPLERARGVIGRYPGQDERYVFKFEDVRPRPVHMVGVRRPLLVTFYAGDEAELEVVLKPWTGRAVAPCGRITEERPPGG